MTIMFMVVTTLMSGFLGLFTCVLAKRIDNLEKSTVLNDSVDSLGRQVVAMQRKMELLPSVDELQEISDQITALSVAQGKLEKNYNEGAKQPTSAEVMKAIALQTQLRAQKRDLATACALQGALRSWKLSVRIRDRLGP